MTYPDRSPEETITESPRLRDAVLEWLPPHAGRVALGLSVQINTQDPDGKIDLEVDDGWVVLKVSEWVFGQADDEDDDPRIVGAVVKKVEVHMDDALVDEYVETAFDGMDRPASPDIYIGGHPAEVAEFEHDPARGEPNDIVKAEADIVRFTAEREQYFLNVLGSL